MSGTIIVIICNAATHRTYPSIIHQTLPTIHSCKDRRVHNRTEQKHKKHTHTQQQTTERWCRVWYRVDGSTLENGVKVVRQWSLAANEWRVGSIIFDLEQVLALLDGCQHHGQLIAQLLDEREGGNGRQGHPCQPSVPQQNTTHTTQSHRAHNQSFRLPNSNNDECESGSVHPSGDFLVCSRRNLSLGKLLRTYT